MEKTTEEKLQKIVKLYFDGHTAAEAIKEVNKKEPFTEGPVVNNLV
ncbi:hypothetical protein [Clostridium sp. CF012]|nr:hypothetical protein [Clostridium sp. CF012]MBU3145753.1 hypothetical protein [Clostridium sp. CF012]